MIRIQYDDSVISNQLYCALQIQREMADGEFSLLYMVRWFGSAEIAPSAGRGELLALAATLGNYRHELILVSPDNSDCTDKVLNDWRARFNRVEYGAPDLSVEKLLAAECSILAASDERAIVDEIIVKNLPPTVFYEQNEDKAVANIGKSLADIDYEKYVFALVEPPSKVVGFRKAFSKQHLQEMVSQANDHNLLMYYSSFTIQGKHVVAEGPWVLLPATLRNFTKPSDATVDVEDLVGDDEDIPPQFSEDAQSADPRVDLMAEDTKEMDREILSDFKLAMSTPDAPEVVEEPQEGFACPYCDKRMKKRFGVTNHVTQKHPEKLDEYNAAKQD